MSKHQGYFVVVEGNDRTGKTTQLPLIEAELKARGYEVVVTREPGGTPFAEKLRHLALSASEEDSLDPVSEMLLMATARHDHYVKVIKPALDLGKVVLCSRGFFSTFAYQVHPHGSDELMALFNHVTAVSMGILGDIRPMMVNLTLSEEERAKRFAERPVEDAIEKRDADYQTKVAEAYSLLENQPGTLTKDASLPAEQIAKEVVEELVGWFAEQDQRFEEAEAMRAEQESLDPLEESEDHDEYVPEGNETEESSEPELIDLDALKVELYTELDRHAVNLQNIVPEEQRSAMALEWNEQIQLLRGWVDVHMEELAAKEVQYNRQEAAVNVQKISDNMGALLGSWLTMRNIKDMLDHKAVQA